MQCNMSNGTKRVAVIGAGIFGCAAALALAKTGYKVVLLERLPDILMGTSKNNTNRVHQGFHYPRDIKTATECRDNYRRFETEFREALLDDYPNIYCIAKNYSLTSKEEFIKFCDILGLSYSIIDLNRLDVKINGCNLGISCHETIVDSDLLRNMLISKIKNTRNLTLSCNTEVALIKKSKHQYVLSFLSEDQSKQSFDAVINCSYANINV
jgi:L-2-hydroxyglutarate oxidase LhgO